MRAVVSTGLRVAWTRAPDQACVVVPARSGGAGWATSQRQVPRPCAGRSRRGQARSCGARHCTQQSPEAESSHGDRLPGVMEFKLWRDGFGRAVSFFPKAETLLFTRARGRVGCGACAGRGAMRPGATAVRRLAAGPTAPGAGPLPGLGSRHPGGPTRPRADQLARREHPPWVRPPPRAAHTWAFRGGPPSPSGSIPLSAPSAPFCGPHARPTRPAIVVRPPTAAGVGTGAGPRAARGAWPRRGFVTLRLHLQ